MTTLDTSVTSMPVAPAEPWRRRLMRTLLYGRNSNRAAKARARIGLAILAFAAVFAIIAVILGSTVGWVCYGLAVFQYLIIGLVTSRDKALDVLAEFDRQVARKREELIEEFQIDQSKTDAPLDPVPESASQEHPAKAER